MSQLKTHQKPQPDPPAAFDSLYGRFEQPDRGLSESPPLAAPEPQQADAVQNGKDTEMNRLLQEWCSEHQVPFFGRASHARS
jgi:hypothetical protein